MIREICTPIKVICPYKTPGLRNYYKAYLYQSNDTFSKAYEFINPNFSAEEKIIRGIGYGHPGEVEPYKYKWNGLQVDTLEYIFPDSKHKGQFIKTKKLTYKPSEENGIILKSLPKEYLSVENIHYFTSY